MLLRLILLALLNKFLKSTGFSLVELVLAIAIFMIYIGSLAVAATSSHLTRLENAKLAQASFYFEEGWEAVKAIRNDDWLNITDGTHGLSSSGASWGFVGTSDTYEGFSRSITVTTVDPDTKLIAVEVAWSPIPSKDLSISAETYLTNYKNEI